MKSNDFFVVKGVLRTALAGFLAASTLAFAQDSSAPQPPATSGDPQQQSTSSSGGWKKVGDNSQVYNPPNSDSQNANQAGDPNQAQDQNQAPDQNQPQDQNQTQDPNQAPPPANYPPANNAQYGQRPNQQQKNYPPPPPVPAQLTIPAGTYATVRVEQTLSSDKNQPGDPFVASLVQPIVVNGVVVAEPGETLGGQVVTAEKHHFDKPARLGLALTNLTLVDGQQVPITTQFINRQGGTTPGGAEVGTVAATTGVGAVIGAAAGWGTGAAIGAGAGAAAGLIGVLVTRNHASVIYPEQVLTFKIEAPVTFSTANSTQAFRYVQPYEYDRPPEYANNGGNGAGMYQGGAPAASYGYAYPNYGYYGYGYPYYSAYGWGYPYWGGVGIGFYGGYWGGGYWGRGGYWGGRGWGPGGYYGGHYLGGGRYYSGPNYGARSGFAAGGFHGAAIGGGGFHGGGGHR